jgi:hypothetical protein
VTKKTALIAFGSLVATIPFSAGLLSALDQYHAPPWLMSFAVAAIMIKGVAVVIGFVALVGNWDVLE